MFTLEKTSNNVNFREFLNKYLPVRWSRSRSKVTAPASAKYPGRHRLRNPATKPPFFADLGQFCLTSPVSEITLDGIRYFILAHDVRHLGAQSCLCPVGENILRPLPGGIHDSSGIHTLPDQIK